MTGPLPRGICFTRQFPNPAEPLRGPFVAEQIAATRGQVDWRVVAPIAWPLRHRSAPVPERGEHGGVPVAYPRYPVLPRRLLFTRVAESMARAARGPFAAALAGAEPGRAFVHAHELYPSAAAVATLAAAAHVPLVISVHGSDLYTNLDDPRWKHLIETAAHAARRIVCVSTRLADDVVAELGVDPMLVTVIPDTYDAARFRFVERTHASNAPLRVATVARLSAEKGVDVLLEALAVARRGGLDLEAVVIGDGPQRAALERQAARLGLSVRFAGRLAGSDLLAELAAADLYCQPSRREGFGVALVEALATGLPAVATDSGGPGEIVGHEDGELVEPGNPDALAAGLVSAVARLGSFDRAGIAGRVAGRFGPVAVGTALLGVYGDVLEEGGA